MKVAFDFTVDDMVEVAERAADRSTVVTSTRSQARLIVSMVSAVIVYFFIPASQGFRLVCAAAAGALGWYLYPGDFKKLHRKKLRKFFLEQFGGEGPFTCEVELTDQALVTEQSGSRIVREWKTIAAVLDTPDSIDFVCIGSGSLVVRNRAFTSKAQRDEFLHLARTYALSGAKK